MVSFSTGLTGWLDRSRSFVFLNLCIACVGIVGNFIVGVRVGLTTVIVVVIVSTIRVVSAWSFSRLSRMH